MDISAPKSYDFVPVSSDTCAAASMNASPRLHFSSLFPGCCGWFCAAERADTFTWQEMSNVLDEFIEVKKKKKTIETGIEINLKVEVLI